MCAKQGSFSFSKFDPMFQISDSVSHSCRKKHESEDFEVSYRCTEPFISKHLSAQKRLRSSCQERRQFTLPVRTEEQSKKQRGRKTGIKHRRSKIVGAEHLCPFLKARFPRFTRKGYALLLKRNKQRRERKRRSLAVEAAAAVLPPGKVAKGRPRRGQVVELSGDVFKSEGKQGL
jgi:hypothetical protein